MRSGSVRRPDRSTTPGNSLVGRQAELHALERFLGDLAGGAASLSILGDAGIGKTALWKEGLAVAGQRGYRLLVSRPAESEARLPYAGLGDLLEGVGEYDLAPLPSPQRRAVEIALVRVAAEGPPPQQRAVALGLLAIIRELSTPTPVLIAVDDVHWLDQPSRRVLEFVARRLSREAVGILATCRTGDSEVDFGVGAATASSRSARLVLGTLPASDLDELLRRRVGELRLSRSVRARIRDASGGNPFFALELSAELARQQPTLASGEPLPVPESLAELIRRRAVILSPRSRVLSLTVAALAQPTVAVLTAACGPQAGRSLARAIDAGVLEIEGDRVRFSHPLIGSVLYGGMSPAARRELHSRLAVLVEEPEERARHLALATTAPDADVACTLEEAARRARARGAPDAAAELLDRAWQLTPAAQADDARARRVSAADCLFEAGDTDRARVLLEQAVEEWPSGPGRADPLTSLAWICAHREGRHRAAGLFAEARAEVPSELRTRIGIERGLSWSEHMGGDLAAADRHARAALAMAEELSDPILLAEALADVGFLEMLTGQGVPKERMERAVALERSGEEWRPIFGRAEWLYALVLQWANDYESSRERLEALLRGAVERGDEHSLPFVLTHLCRVELCTGRWVAAARYAEECYVATLQTGQEPERAFALSNLAMVNAHLGRIERAQEAIEEGLALADSAGLLPARYELLATLGFLELSLNRPAEAARILGDVDAEVGAAGFAEPGVFRHEGNLIEAVVALGDLERAEMLTSRLEQRGGRPGRRWAPAVGARCRAQLEALHGETESARLTLERALEQHAALDEPFELGRTLLVCGAVERRSRRKRDARQSFEGALEIFGRLEAALWSAKTKAELERAGGRAERTQPLTPTESRIAELVAAGHTNKDVASALFLSPKTVEWNLSKIYRKLDVRTRSQLAAKLVSSSPPEG